MVEFNIDSGKSCCFFIGTDSDGVTSELCMVQNKFHQKNQNNHPQETDRITVSASSCTDCKFKDRMEPSAFLCKTRPRCSGTERSGTAGNHTGTKSCKKRRQIHYADKNTVQCSDQNSKKHTNQHSNNNRYAMASYQSSADQCITYHTCSDGKVYASGNKRESNTDCHQKIIV